MMVGGLAQLILGRHGGRVNWTLALFAGFGGSFIGGLLASLVAGDGLAIKPSGIIGSLVGALAITAAWQWYTHKQAVEARAAAKAKARSGRHH